jgi:dTDP-4-dehydrorhamnose 3,5-epimerase-like enzyme
VSARIDENGVKTKKLWQKHDSRGLFVEDLKLEGLRTKKMRATT